MKMKLIKKWRNQIMSFLKIIFYKNSRINNNLGNNNKK